MSKFPKTEFLALDEGDGWLGIWFDQPEARNPLSDGLVRELREVLDIVAADLAIRGISLRGKGGVFSAGGDLKTFRTVFQGGNPDIDSVLHASRSAGELFRRLNTMPQVVLILVEGAAMAGGLGIVCTGDIVAVTASAKFALTETTLGIPPAQIAPFVVQRLGRNTARRLMLTATRFDGTEAMRLGLADFLVADSAGLDEIEAQIKKQVMRCAPNANAITKELVLAIDVSDPDAMLERAAQAFSTCMLGDEAREGIAAFLEKRSPVWAE